MDQSRFMSIQSSLGKLGITNDELMDYLKYASVNHPEEEVIKFYRVVKGKSAPVKLVIPGTSEYVEIHPPSGRNDNAVPIRGTWPQRYVDAGLIEVVKDSFREENTNMSQNNQDQGKVVKKGQIHEDLPDSSNLTEVNEGSEKSDSDDESDPSEESQSSESTGTPKTESENKTDVTDKSKAETEEALTLGDHLARAEANLDKE